jgi:hypothetical protein
MDCAASELRREQAVDRLMELMLRIWFLEEMGAFDKQGFHLFGDGIAGRVEHGQLRPEPHRLVRNLAPAKNRCLEIDIGEESVNALRGTQEQKRSVYVAGRKYAVTPVLYHHLRQREDEHIVFDDQYHGHLGSSRRDDSPILPELFLPQSRRSKPFQPLSGLMSELAPGARVAEGL